KGSRRGVAINPSSRRLQIATISSDFAPLPGMAQILVFGHACTTREAEKPSFKSPPGWRRANGPWHEPSRVAIPRRRRHGNGPTGPTLRVVGLPALLTVEQCATP